MDIKLIEERFKKYHCRNKLEELNALKEIMQEVVLFSLSNSKFFKISAFHGGTSLRILYGLPRFSEDLDFSLISDSEFSWDYYLEKIKTDCDAFGFSITTVDRSHLDQAVKKAFVKDSSFGQVLSLRHQRNKSDSSVINIRLEIDTNPPQDFMTENKFCNFPIPFPVVAFDPPTLFAGKINAILTRPFSKGRDWFDLLWYLTQGTRVNLAYLHHALQQFSYSVPESIDSAWLKTELKKCVEQQNFVELRKDVTPLLPTVYHNALDLWSQDFFNDRLLLLT